MRLSSFNLFVNDYPEPGSVLVNNTFSGAFAVLDQETVGLLRRLDRGDERDASDASDATDELLSDLADPDVGIMVESLAREQADFSEWFERRRRSGRRLDVIVGVNLACNFECSYCSQANVLDGTVMKPETVDSTADWLAQRAIESGLDSLHITFVGGEPLLHTDRLVRLAGRLRGQLGDRTLTLGLITNGYFLDDQVLDALIPLGLVNAQITLDGNRETHCSTRISKRGEDTFDRIFDNVIRASRRIAVRVNGNYQPDTVHGFAPLLEELEAAGFPSGSSITFSPALQGLSSDEGAGSGSCTWTGGDSAHQVALQDQVRARGYDPGGPLNAVGPCELHDVHHYSIDPRGDIHKCPGFMGHESWSIGHVSSGLTDRYEHFLTLTPKQACGGCAHRPNCGGGCLATEWLREGTTDGVNCAAEYFESVTAAAVSRQYEQEMGTSHSVEHLPPTAFGPSVSAQPVANRSRRPSGLRVIAA